jgi:hypothetical protein
VSRRTGLSVRVRFEAFKRDRFTCQYCGKHPPDVLLEADHILPVSAGGADTIENLVTACQECNRGKSDRLLQEGVAPAPTAQVVDELRERVAQAKAYAALAAELSEAMDDQAWQVTLAWGRAFRAEELTDANGEIRLRFVYLGSAFIPESSIRSMLRRGLGVESMLEAVDICAGKFSAASPGAHRYFFGICWKKLRDTEGG